MLPPERLEGKRLLEISNAQVRTEFVKKVGVERICSDLGAKTIDTASDYALLELDLGDGRRRPYLKMKNPSTNEWHVEGVHPTCTTVREAINWRAGDINEDWEPEQLT